MKKRLAVILCRFMLCGVVLGMSACSAGTLQTDMEQQTKQQANVDRHLDVEQLAKQMETQSVRHADQGEMQAVEQVKNEETLKENSGAKAQMTEAENTAKLKRMLIANGTLYEDTGYVSGVWGRCGNLDGNIVSVIDGAEIPTEDGQANFQAPGWQMGFEENTIEVPVDGEYCIFAAQGSKEEGYIPLGVANFLATVEEVADDGYVIVKTDLGVPELFRGKIKENERYKFSLEHYTCDINIPVENVTPGVVLQVVCKNDMEDTDPAVITDVYSVSPLHSNVCQPGQYPPESDTKNNAVE